MHSPSITNAIVSNFNDEILIGKCFQKASLVNVAMLAYLFFTAVNVLSLLLHPYMFSSLKTEEMELKGDE